MLNRMDLTYLKNGPLSISINDGSLYMYLMSTWHPQRMMGTRGQSLWISGCQWFQTCRNERGWTTEKQTRMTSALFIQRQTRNQEQKSQDLFMATVEGHHSAKQSPFNLLSHSFTIAHIQQMFLFNQLFFCLLIATLPCPPLVLKKLRASHSIHYILQDKMMEPLNSNCLFKFNWGEQPTFHRQIVCPCDDRQMYPTDEEKPGHCQPNTMTSEVPKKQILFNLMCTSFGPGMIKYAIQACQNLIIWSNSWQNHPMSWFKPWSNIQEC